MAAHTPMQSPVVEGGPGRSRAWIVAALVLAVTVAHMVTPPDRYVLHNIYQRLYYLPIILASAWFSRRIGIVTALACGAAYIPHIVLHWEHHRPYQISQFAEILMFLAIAVLAGTLLDREKALRSAAEETARERDRALRDLEETVETLRRADRLATLGTMAAGMAHEIRNPLGALLGATEILGRDYPLEHPRREFFDILERELGRLNSITTRYVDFARPQPPELEAVAAGEVVSAAVDLIRKSAQRANVTIDVSVEEALPRILADPVHLHQALVNLLVNAVQAMPDGGTVEIVAVRTGPSQVEIAVRDHGVGLPDGQVERIFEPFFSSRRGGTGLGLAIARQIARNHGGDLVAERAAGGGSRFRLSLRAVPAEDR